MNDEPEFGFSLPLPPEVARALMGGDSERTKMRARAKGAQIEDFLDSLDVGQLIALREVMILNRHGLHHVDGQVTSILRLVHKVDPITGLTAEEQLAEAMLES